MKGQSAHPDEASYCRTPGEGGSGRKAGLAHMEKGNRREGRKGNQASGQGLPRDDGEEETILRESSDFPQLKLSAIFYIQITVCFERLY